MISNQHINHFTSCLYNRTEFDADFADLLSLKIGTAVFGPLPETEKDPENQSVFKKWGFLGYVQEEQSHKQTPKPINPLSKVKKWNELLLHHWKENRSKPEKMQQLKQLVQKIEDGRKRVIIEKELSLRKISKEDITSELKTMEALIQCIYETTIASSPIPIPSTSPSRIQIAAFRSSLSFRQAFCPSVPFLSNWGKGALNAVLPSRNLMKNLKRSKK